MVEEIKSGLAKLINADDREKDSLIIYGGIGVVALVVLSLINLASGHGFDPQNFGIGFASIVGALGLGKAARDWQQGEH